MIASALLSLSWTLPPPQPPRTSISTTMAAAACSLCLLSSPFAPPPLALAADSTTLPAAVAEAKSQSSSEQFMTKLSVATPDEKKALMEAAGKMPEQPAAPAGSDLAKLLSGETSLPSSVSSPRAHN